jgi:hypothetical protein
MKDDSLENQLRAFKVPVPSESGRARARHRALFAFQQPGLGETESREPRNLIANWRTAVGLAVALSVFAFLMLSHRAPESSTDDRQMLGQMEKLFPNRINAVVEEEGKVNLAIADSDTMGSGQPVVVVFKHGSDTIRVLSYSGHRVCLMLGQTERCIELLATPTGGVILEEKDKAWLASDCPEIAGYSVQAKSLELSL